MSSADIITLPQILSKVPELVSNLPAMIKGSKMAKITDTKKPLGLGVAIEEATSKNPNGAAVIYQDTELTYKQFNAWANRIADYLASIGLKKGDTVAVNVENRPELLASVVACTKLGVCAALINTSQRGKVLIHSLNLVKPKAAIVGAELVETVEEVRGELDPYPSQKPNSVKPTENTCPPGVDGLQGLLVVSLGPAAGAGRRGCLHLCAPP